MLQTERNHGPFNPDSESPPPEASFSIPELIAFVLGFIRRRLWVVVIPCVVVCALGLPLVFKLVVPLYNAAANVYIDNRKVQIVKDQPVQDRSIDGYVLESQIEILKSENVGLAVVRNLHLANEPEFGIPKPGLLSALLGRTQTLSEFDRQRRALGVLDANMFAKRLGATYVIEISYKSEDAERAATVANAIANAYINDLLEGKLFTSQRTIELLNDRLKVLSDQVTEAQGKVNSFRAENKIVENGDGRTVNEQQISQLGSQQIEARQRAAAANAKLASIEEIINANTDDAVVFASVPDTAKTDFFTKQREEYLKKENRYRELLAVYSADHSVVIKLRNEMRGLRVGMREELKRVAEGYKNEYELSKRYEDSLQQEINTAQSQSIVTNEVRVKLHQLESVAKSLRSEYDDLLQKRNGMVQQQSLQESSQISEARIISKATPPPSKDYRKFLVGALAVPVGGLGLGLALALFLELMDDVFHTERQVHKALGARCLAIVPMWKEAEQGTNSGWTSTGSVAPRTILRDQSPLWSVSDSPFSYFAESVRSIKAAADLYGAGNTVKVIGFTSAVPNEGKSTIAASLAQAVAQSGSRVILVDCDLRNPSLSASLAPVADRGLVEVISGKATLNEVVWTDPTTSMAFLPTVMKSRVAQTNEILASDATKKLLDTLRLMYDYVVVDLSPLAPVVDVRATVNLVDTYVFVIEWGKTHTSVVRRTLEAAPSVVDNLLGVVLNKTDMKLLRQYDSHVSKYHEKGYYRY
jgi:succinoglycan biosynthesis transport protein ExoP